MSAESEHEPHVHSQATPTDPPPDEPLPTEYAGAGLEAGGDPQFIPSPGEDIRADQPGMAPPAGAPGPAPPPRRPDHGRHDPPQAGPKPPPRTTDAQGMSSGGRLVANMMLIALGAGLMAGGFALGRAYAPPRPPGEVSNQMPPDAVAKEDMKKTTDQVEKLRTDLDGLGKRVDARPDYGPDVKMIRDDLTALKGTVTDYPARLDSLTQKVDTVSRTQMAQSGGGADPRGDVDKRLADLSAVVDNLRSELNSRPSAANPPRDVNAEGQAMEQAVGLFRAKKFNEARDAFRKLQATYPDDARVTYYAALSNGWATGDWQNETVRLVNTAMEQEKSGRPGAAQVDAAFANLTKAEGKEWLDGYRQRIKAK